MSTTPYKRAVELAIQTGKFDQKKNINSGKFGIPKVSYDLGPIASVRVKEGKIRAIGDASVNHARYILNGTYAPTNYPSKVTWTLDGESNCDDLSFC
jgi:hypothetical protein